ncbi:MAG TPA: hypothetical protein VFN78_04500 [Ktedonobacterales bacterium]|nr:hypothetical protein [Ktedonobacterales bacterium]
MAPRARGGKGSLPKPVKAPASPASAASQRGQQSTTLITVVLALLLLAVGAAGYEAASLLHYAMSTPSPINASAASTATFVCDALKRQDYQQLVTYIDPAPVPPSVTGAFDARLTIAQLRTVDANQGKVVSCATGSYGSGSIVSTDGATRYQLVIRRANAATPASGTLVLRKATGGAHGWLIERDSSFLTPGAA